MRKKRSIKYSYMAGSRQHLTCSFMRACLRCLTLVGTDALLLYFVMYLLLLLLWCWCCIAVGCGVATTAAFVHEETEETHTQRKRTRKRKKSVPGKKQRKAGNVQQVIDGGGVQVGTSERPRRCQTGPLRKKI